MYFKQSHRIAVFGITLALLLAAGSTMALAISPGRQHVLLDALAHMKQARQKELMQIIALMPQQEAQIKEIKDQARRESEPLLQETVNRYEHLIRYLASPDANESEALAMKQEALAAQEKMATVRIHAIFQMKAVLSDQQNQKVAALVEHRVSEFEAKRPELRQKLQEILSD